MRSALPRGMCELVLTIGCFLLVSLTVNGQADTLELAPPPIEEPPPTQQELEAAWFGAAVRVPGTKVSLMPPPGFRLATNFTGFEKDAFTAMTVMDLDGGNFYTNAATYTKEKFEGKGLLVLEFERLKVDGYPAIRALIKSPVDGSLSHQLVFGDTTFSAMVVGLVPSVDTSSSNSVRHALGTVTYDKEVVVGPYEGTSFRANDRSTELKFAKKGGGIWLYSRDGVSKTSYGDDEPVLMALPVPFGAPYTCTSMADKMISGLEEKGFSKSHTTNVSTKRVNGFDGYEAEYYGTMKGEQTVIYMLVVAFGDRAVVFEGKATEPFQPALKMFKTLAHTVSFQ